MSAVTENRDTKEREGRIRRFPVLAAEIMYAGGLAAVLKSTGEAEMASDKAGLVVVGRVEEYVDNTNDGEQVNAKAGIFKLANSESHPVTAALIGQDCFVEDDQTVSASGGTNSVVAGKVFDIDTDGVYVEAGFAEPLAAAVAALTGTLTGTANGALVDIAATAAACAGEAAPSAAQVDTAIATAVATIVTGANEQLKELQTTVNALIASLKAAGVIA